MIRFIGGATFAALLILFTALMVIYATFLEGQYNSHEVAVEQVYQSSIFNALLIGFFINILFSTLRRYPFHKKHIPFILTHIGLLMVISGTVIKNVYGIQGKMTLLEGSSRSKVSLSGSKALHIDGISYLLKDSINHKDLSVQVSAMIPHTNLTYTAAETGRPLGFKIEASEDLTAMPSILLQCTKHGLQEKIALFFEDRFLWPIFGHLMAFKPHEIEIPHKIRLHQARKICHPALNLAAAYEADVTINGNPFTLKMNEVYEADDQTRFYLASMTDQVDDAKQITIVVNYDPVRNTLTYPGALLVVLGAVLLFFRKKP